jgi:hypothetical protein
LGGARTCITVDFDPRLKKATGNCSNELQPLYLKKELDKTERKIFAKAADMMVYHVGKTVLVFSTLA